MTQIVLTDDFLTEAAMRFDKQWTETLQAPENCVHVFPEGFRENILHRADRRQKLISYSRRAAVAIIAILISAVILFAASPDVRAAVKGWFRETFGEHAIYHFTESAGPEELVPATLSYIPEGFEKADEINTEIRNASVYRNAETEQTFLFQTIVMTDNMYIELIGENVDTYERLDINGKSAYFYSDQEIPQTNNLIWFDDEKQLGFIIDSSLEKDVMLHIAEGIILEDSTN